MRGWTALSAGCHRCEDDVYFQSFKTRYHPTLPLEASMVPDSLQLLLESVSGYYQDRIQTYHASAIQFDDVLLQLRVLSMAIVVGIATIRGEIKKLGKWANVLLGVIIFSLLLYDTFIVDQQIRRNRMAQSIVPYLVNLHEMTYEELAVTTFPKPEDLDPDLEAGTFVRWCHRVSNVNALQGYWYSVCCIIGFALLRRNNQKPNRSKPKQREQAPK